MCLTCLMIDLPYSIAFNHLILCLWTLYLHICRFSVYDDLAGSKLGFNYLEVSLGLESMSHIQVRESWHGWRMQCIFVTGSVSHLITWCPWRKLAKQLGWQWCAQDNSSNLISSWALYVHLILFSFFPVDFLVRPLSGLIKYVLIRIMIQHIWDLSTQQLFGNFGNTLAMVYIGSLGYGNHSINLGMGST